MWFLDKLVDSDFLENIMVKSQPNRIKNVKFGLTRKKCVLECILDTQNL